MRLFIAFWTFLCLSVAVSAQCNTYYDGEFCENPTTQQPNGMPIEIGTLIYYADYEGIPQMGFVIGYWWQFPTQSWDYQVMTRPENIGLGYGMSFENVPPDAIFAIFDEVQLP